MECKSLFISIVPEGRDLLCFYSQCPSKVSGAVLEETSDCVGCVPYDRCCVGLSKPPDNAS